MRRLPTVRVASACEERWEAMTPGPDGRFCARCEKTVVDLSRMTRAQAVAIVGARSGQVCGRVRSDGHGRAVFAPEPARRGLLPVAVAGLLAACAPSAEPSAPPAETATSDGAPPSDLAITTASAGSFGGSIATGVMMPIGPEGPHATPTIAPPTPCAIDDVPVEPTAEQRALTRRKHHRRTIASYPPPPHPMMGMMLLDD